MSKVYYHLRWLWRVTHSLPTGITIWVAISAGLDIKQNILNSFFRLLTTIVVCQSFSSRNCLVLKQINPPLSIALAVQWFRTSSSLTDDKLNVPWTKLLTRSRLPSPLQKINYQRRRRETHLKCSCYSITAALMTRTAVTVNCPDWNTDCLLGFLAQKNQKQLLVPENTDLLKVKIFTLIYRFKMVAELGLTIVDNK